MTTLASRQVLEETPGRALTLLRAIGTSTPIRAALSANGYSPKDHEEGWNLLLQVSGYVAPTAAAPAADDVKVRDAIAELDAWDEQGFRRAHAALARLHAEQDAFVFNGLAPAQGPEAVLRVATFLDRLDALEGSPERKASAKADQAALKTLAVRGIDATERARLRELVQIARSAPAVHAPDAEQSAAAEKRTQALIDLRSWFEDWSETARAVIVRRDHLIRLGLAKRKQPKAAPGEPSPSEPTPIVD